MSYHSMVNNTNSRSKSQKKFSEEKQTHVQVGMKPTKLDGIDTTTFTPSLHFVPHHKTPLSLFTLGDYKHWIQNLRTRNPTIYITLFHLAFMTECTCVNVLSSNVQLYPCWSQSTYCNTHSRRSSHLIVQFRTIA